MVGQVSVESIETCATVLLVVLKVLTANSLGRGVRMTFVPLVELARPGVPGRCPGFIAPAPGLDPTTLTPRLRTHLQS